MLDQVRVLTLAAARREIEKGGLLAVLVSNRGVAGCHIMAATLASIAAEYSGRVSLAIVDLRNDPAGVSRWLAPAAPSLIFFIDGAVVDRLDGVVPRGQITRRLNLMLNARRSP